MFEFNISIDNIVDPTELYDLIIIGGGPAGLTAGLYAARYKLRTLLIEKAAVSGGQLTSTEWVENYPGFPEPVLGKKLASDMETQAKSFGLLTITESVNTVDLDSRIKTVTTDYNTWHAKAILIATGSSSRKLGLKGEAEFSGKGVSYCATCDGPLYPDKDIVVVGGGNSAFEESLFLAKYARKVTILNRSDNIKADPIIKERVFADQKIEILTNTFLKSIEFSVPGDKHLLIHNSITDKTTKLPTEGLFIFIGHIPNTDLFKDKLDLENGYIIADKHHQTSQRGVWAAGDVQAKALRQVATAVGDGACAAHWIYKYIENWDNQES